jgi:hypothetical protein
MWLIFLSFQLRMETHVYHSPCTTLTPLADLIRINRLGSVFCWFFLGNISQLIGFNTRQYLGLAKFFSFMTLIVDFLHGVLEQGLKVMYHIVLTWIQLKVMWGPCNFAKYANKLGNIWTILLAAFALLILMLSLFIHLMMMFKFPDHHLSSRLASLLMARRDDVTNFNI